jgi:ATP-dependent Clp protease protease subunit
MKEKVLNVFTLALLAVGVGMLGLAGYNLYTEVPTVGYKTVQSPKLNYSSPASQLISPLASPQVQIQGQSFEQTKRGSVTDSVKTLKQLNVDLSRTIELQGSIGLNAIAASILMTKLSDESSEPIYLLIDSPGGSVITGARLISAMQASRSKVVTVCLSLCASMGFMIHQYGTERYALDRAILMSHPATVGYEGDVDRIASFIGTIQRFTNKMEAEIAKRMGLTFEQYKQKIQNEYWVDSEDALADKVIDGLVYISVTGSKVNLDIPIDVSEKARRSDLFDIIWIMPKTNKVIR